LPAAATSHRRALELFRDLGDEHGQMFALIGLRDVQRLTGAYRAAAGTVEQAQALSCDLGARYWQVWVLNQLSVLHRLTGDYPAAAASPSADLHGNRTHPGRKVARLPVRFSIRAYAGRL
jgi:hypothetical protein